MGLRAIEGSEGLRWEGFGILLCSLVVAEGLIRGEGVGLRES